MEPDPVVTSDPHIDDVPIIPEDEPGYDPAVTIFVSPYGDDEAGDGSWAAPYATLAGAKEAVKTKKAASDSTITVYFRGGTYHFDATAVMDAEDSGKSENAPIVYKPWDGEKVLFEGGYHIEPFRITSAADSPVAAVIPDPEIASKLMVIDLDIEGKLLPGYKAKYGDYNCSLYGKSIMAPEVYLGDTALTRARWPKDGMVVIDNIMSYTENNDADEYDGKSKSWTLTVLRELAKKFKTWSQDSVNYVGMVGYLANDFTYEHFHLYGLDTQKGKIKFRTYYHGWGECASPRAYFENIPEEIALPGDSYLDEGNKRMYFYPTEDFDIDHVYYGDLTTLIKMTGTEHIVFEGIEFRYTLNDAIVAEGIRDLTFRNCRIGHTSAHGVNLDGTGILISGCEVYDTNFSAIYVKGGDNRTLTSGECIIENCLIHDTLRNRSFDGDEGMIRCDSHGAIIRNNEMYGACGRVLVIESGECLIEYNEIYDCMTEAADMAVLYYFGNMETLGMVFRYNYLHDIGNSYGFNQCSIYLDGSAIPPEIYGNIFCNASGYNENGTTGAIILGYAEFAHIYNNVFVDNFRSAVSSASGNVNRRWLYEWIGLTNPGMNSAWGESLIASDFDSEIYHDRFDGTVFGRFYEFLTMDKYLQYRDMTQSELTALGKTVLAETGKNIFPSNTNIFENNIQVHNQSVLPDHSGSAPNYRDTTADENGIFVSYENRDFHLTEEGLAKVREVLPDFAEIPIDQIGRFAND